MVLGQFYLELENFFQISMLGGNVAVSRPIFTPLHAVLYLDPDLVGTIYCKRETGNRTRFS